jgi:uncharacterized protein
MVVYRLEPFGPGLGGLPPDPATPMDALAPGSLIPDERCYLTAAHDVPKGEISTGTWAASKHTCKMAPYPISEFCYILQGKVYITTDDNAVEVFGPGDAFYIEEGTMLEWKQLDVVRKYFVIYSKAEEEEEDDEADSFESCPAKGLPRAKL